MELKINELSKQIYEDNVAKGVWPECPSDRNIGEALMLIVSELGEAMEAHRKGDRACENVGDISNENFQKFVKDTFEDELADAVIRILDLAHGMGIDLEWHIKAKLKYNKSRPFKYGKKY